VIEQTPVSRDAETVFASHAWQSAWWRYLGQGRARLDLHEPGGQLVANLAQQTLGPFTLVTSVGSGLVSRAPITWTDPHVAALILATAVAGSRRSLWLLRHVPSELALALRESAPRAGAHVSVLPEGAACVVSLPNTWDAYVRMLSRRRRVHAARLARRWTARTNASVRHVEDPAKIRAAVAELFDLARRRQLAAWGRVYPFFADEKVQAFLEQAATALAEERCAFVGQLAVGNRVVAADLVLASGATWHCLAGGFDPRWAAGSPGTWLDLQLIRAAIAAGVERLDLGRGDARYKLWLAAHRVPLRSVVLWSVSHLSGRTAAALVAPGLALASACAAPVRRIQERSPSVKSFWHALAATPTR
jgi:CelD/BcsL family acetyltransferase involved in cellulose biosynthesis